jgi:periplasmic divalent cation tolerance protein
MSETLLVFCTCPDRSTALVLANILVEGELAACVTLQSPVTSIYRWAGNIEQAEEHLLLIKTSALRYPDLEHAILVHHPYKIPEILALPIEHGLPDYIAWIKQCTGTLL